MRMLQILVVDDDVELCELVAEYLEPDGYKVEAVHDGQTGLERALSGEHALAVLDYMLPGLNGFELLKQIRSRSRLPVVMLTARGDAVSRIVGLQIGADDYLPKPFDLEIFIARLKALLRRGEWSRHQAVAVEQPETVVINGRTVDFENLELTSEDDTKIHLTLMEMKLLRFLIENEGRAVSRKTILEEVWDLQEDTDTRAIDNFIVRLRRYLEDRPASPKILLTVRGVGYKFVAQHSSP